jgi:hypothetical protein
VGLARVCDARTPLGQSFEHQGSRGVHVRDAAQVELELRQLRGEGGRTGVLQAAHVRGAEASDHSHPEGVDSAD